MIIKGQLIDNRYKIIKSIGEGGMANVYLGYDTILQREVAVKILRGDLAEDDKFVRRFQREANAASSLKHPNIVEVYDVGEDNGQFFIVMEYINGKTLKSLIKKRGALTKEEVVDIMLQLTSAVACAHDSFIIHRDIKPQNVMILEDGRVKITDFGIAMALNSNELTQTNSVMGSVHYLPPEQASGSGSTTKSDIYSLGILMFELLTGKLPFKGDNAVEIAIKQMKEAIPSVREIDPSIPQPVENIVYQACAKNPKNRYASVRDMYEDIKTSLDPIRRDEQRINYRYPENDLDETKVMPDLSRLKTAKMDDEVKEENQSSKDKKKNKKKVIIISSIIGVLLVGIITTFLVMKLSGKNKITIPNDLVGETEKDVVEILEDLDLKVKVKKDYNAKYDKGMVFKTRPKEKSRVDKKSTVIIYVSKGLKKVTVEDYTGKDKDKIKKNLEKYGVRVVLTSEKIDKSKDIKENSIISQSVKPGEKLSKGDAIELTYATLITVYPDFTTGEYDKAAIQKFCDENSITCTFTEQESTKTTGSIISQNPTANTEVRKGDTLKVTIAKTQTFTVSFNSNGGSKVSSQTVNYNDFARQPDTKPTKTNKSGKSCTFERWEYNGKEFAFNSTPITSNITLNAVWTGDGEGC